MVVLLYWMGTNLFRQADLTDRSDQVMAQTYACRLLVIDMEAGLRGFQVTGDERFLEPYRAAETNIVGEFDKLEKLISDNPRQTERLKAIRSAFNVWHEFATDMRLRRERGGDFQEGAANLRGKALMDATRARFDEFISDETRLRQEQNEKTARLKKYYMGKRLGLGIPLAFALGWFMRRKLLGLAANYDVALVEANKQRTWFQVTLGSIGDAVITTCNEGKITFLNPVAEKMTGWTVRDAAGLPLEKVFNIVHEETRETAENPIAKALREGNIVGLANHTALVAKDGTETCIEDSAAPIRDDEQKIIGAVMVFHDVTERRRAEELTLVSEVRYRRLFEESDDGILLLDPASRKITSANPFMAELLGYTREELVGRELWQIGLLKDESKSQIAFRELQDKGRIRYENLPLQNKSGERLEVEFVGNIYQEDGQKVIQCNIRDITARKQASQYARSLLEASLDPLVTISAEGKITDVNEGSIKVTGVAREKLIGTDFSDYFTKPEQAREGYQQVFAKGFVTDYPLTIRHKDGRLTDVLYNASVYKDAGGNVLGVFAAARDITARKQVEEGLRKAQQQLEGHAETLEKTVNERTVSLRETIEQLEEFSYSVAHDLRAPLRAMQGYAKAVLKDYGDQIGEEGKDYLQRISSAGLRMDALTRDVLTYSKVARASMPREPVLLDKLVSEIIQHYPQMQVAQAEITVESPLLPVLGNETWLTQAISNLLGNAVKFVPEGTTPQVRVRSESRNGEVRLWIEDNGIGIKPEHQKRLFGMFERVHLNEKYEGTGIGLAIVRKSIERMGGTVGLESDGETGSQFWIQLPAPQKKS